MNVETNKQCKVCGDWTRNNYYGQQSCNACRKFFRRTVVFKKFYYCHANQDCQVNIKTRNHCQWCRFTKCLKIGVDHSNIKNNTPNTKVI